jgi:hypothetical protein
MWMLTLQFSSWVCETCSTWEWPVRVKHVLLHMLINSCYVHGRIGIYWLQVRIDVSEKLVTSVFSDGESNSFQGKILPTFRIGDGGSRFLLNFGTHLQGRKWLEQFYAKHWQPYTRLYGVSSKMTVIYVYIAERISKLIWESIVLHLCVNFSNILSHCTITLMRFCLN